MIVDTHFHLWDLSHPVLRYTWLRPEATHPMLGEVGDLKRSFMLPDYIAAARAAGVHQAVHVQCADPLPDPVAETAWLSRLADIHGFPHAIVAYADLAGAGVDHVLAGHAAFPLVRGIRDLDSTATAETGVRQRHQGVSRLAAFGFHYELRAVVHDADETGRAVDLCRQVPDVTVVLTHAGLPLDRSGAYLEQWRSQLARLAALDNVVCKASGFGMGGFLTGQGCPPATVRDLVLSCVEAFGPDRVMLGSNWPIDILSWTYGDIVSAYRSALADLDPAERRAVTGATAARVYGLGPSEGTDGAGGAGRATHPAAGGGG